jgi:hypothetical protein
VLGITAGVGIRPNDIAGAAPIAVTFSEAMNQGSAQSAFTLRPEASGTFKWRLNTLIFTPNRPLTPNTAYRIEVSARARTVSGKPIVAPHTASFKTAPPPSILRTLPSAGASEVPTDTLLTLSFSRPMVPLTALDKQPDIERWVTISPPVRGRWVWLGTAAAGFRPASGFLPATEYTVQVKAGWPDSDGVPMPQGVTFRFTTIKPAITSVEPYNGSEDVPPDAPVVVRFNQPVEHGSVQAAFKLRKVAGPELPGSYAWSRDSTVMTFTAASLLEFEQTYRASFEGRVKTAGGTPADLQGGTPTNSWRFTTVQTTRVIDHEPRDDDHYLFSQYNQFRFRFNNPLAPNQDVAKFLTIDPAPQGYVGQLTIEGTTVYTDEIRLLPNTTYNFRLREGLKDKWGFAVAPYEWQVKIGPLPAHLRIAGGSFQPIYSEGPSRVRIQVTNVPSVTLRLYEMTEDAARLWAHEGRAVGQLMREWQVSAPNAENVTTSIYPTLALDAQSDRLPPGYYFLRVEAPGPDRALLSEAMLAVGRTGLITKSDGSDLLVWAVNLSSGAPVPDYPVRVEQGYGAGSNARRGRTGPDGVLRLALGKQKDIPLSVWGEQQGDVALVSNRWSHNMDADYDVRRHRDSNQSEQAAIYTDRPIYRPGQTVYFRGVYRLDDDVRYTLPPAGMTVTLQAHTYGAGYENTQVYTGTATLSPLGTFNGQFTLPASAPTGEYVIGFESPASAPQSERGPYASDLLATVGFQVEEYRKPDFQVSVTTRDNVVQGQPVTATIQTGYYFGGALSNVTATVNLRMSDYYFYWSDPDTGESYAFGEGYGRYYRGYCCGEDQAEPELAHTLRERTDKNGLLAVDVSRYVTTTEGSKLVLVEGQVQDLSNQAVANSGSVVVHQGQYYIGLGTRSYVATANQPMTVTVRTVDSLGERVRPNTPVTLRFSRLEWSPPSEEDGAWTRNETTVGQATVTTDAQGRATSSFTPSVGGEYSVVAEGTDSLKNTIRTSMDFWASSSGTAYSQWGKANQHRLKLVADKAKYKVGDTARIVVNSPFPQATALLTIERGHIKRYRIVNLQGGAPLVEVPLEAGDLPNVYVSLTLLGPAARPGGAPSDWVNGLAIRTGYVNLSLDTSSRQLHVSIEPHGKGPFEPGTTASVTLRLRDSGGNPVAGELSLAVVDEAIFALADDNAPDLFEAFWRERGVNVTTASSFTSGYDTAETPTREILPGSGGGMPRTGGSGVELAPRKVRSDFQDTAFWRATVATRADGSAQVAVPLPDNLTTWRLTALGVTQDTRVGVASVPMTVTQPLLLRPVQPRFFTNGDNPRPQAIVHNNTSDTLHVEASLVVSGAISLNAQPPAVQRLQIAPGTQAVVTWSAKIGKGDAANLRYWVRTIDRTSGPLEDAVAMTLPVKAFAAPEVVATSGEVTGTHAEEPLFLPYSIDPLLGELIVQIAPSLAAATTDSVNYVKEYPYECSEQTTSRFLPLVVLDQVYKEQGRKTTYADEMPGIIERAMKRLAELQHLDGGWGWWQNDQSHEWMTAYVVQGLVSARDAGYTVPPNLLQGGVEQLRSFVGQRSLSIDQTYSLNVRAYTLYVLGLAGPADSDMRQEGKNLVAQAPRMTTHARAWLAMGLAKIGMSSESKTVLDSLVSAVHQSSFTAHWEETSVDYWSMSTDNRATALALDALVTLSPNHPLIPKAVRWLVSVQREGRWSSTQETAVVLISLAHYIRQSKELTADYNWQVSAFDKPMGRGTVNSGNLTQTATLNMPVSQMPRNTLGNVDISRDRDRGKLYYRASLRYYVPGESIESRSEGLAVTRSYYKADGPEGSPINQVNAGELVKVRLTIVVPQTSYYVLVTDPLPAGMEGVNGSLKTTSFTERPRNPWGTRQTDEAEYRYYYWGPFDNVEMRDDRTVLFASYMSPGTYVYEYFARATTPGSYMTLPARAEMMYFPDVFGHSDGGLFTVR